MDGIISTHSAREDGDARPNARSDWLHNFNPLRPRGRRRFIDNKIPYLIKFQPTPPARTETHSNENVIQCSSEFQPTPPARTETPRSVQDNTGKRISTHSAREDGDPRLMQMPWAVRYFNPLRPRGRRPLKALGICDDKDFNPLRPRGRRL